MGDGGSRGLDVAREYVLSHVLHVFMVSTMKRGKVRHDMTACHEHGRNLRPRQHQTLAACGATGVHVRCRWESKQWSHQEDLWAISCKTNLTLSVPPGGPAPWDLPKGVENFCSHKAHTQVFVTAVFIMDKVRK